MQYTHVSNPRWANPEKTMIDMDVIFEGIPDVVPFTASPDDPMDYGRELFDRAVKGDFGPVAEG